MKKKWGYAFLGLQIPANLRIQTVKTRPYGTIRPFSKKWIPVSAMLLFSHVATAQQVRLGVFANPVISWMNSNNSHISNNGEHAGLEFGLLFDKFFAPHYAFASGISIQNMGGVLRYRNGKTLTTSEGTMVVLPGDEVTYNLQYIHVPLGIKLRTVQIGYSTFFAELGLDPMVNVRSRVNISSLQLRNVGINDEISLFYLAYHLSAGIEYQIVGSTSVMAGLTYMNGFTNVTSDAPAKITMNCIEIRLGVLF